MGREGIGKAKRPDRCCRANDRAGGFGGGRREDRRLCIFACALEKRDGKEMNKRLFGVQTDRGKADEYTFGKKEKQNEQIQDRKWRSRSR
jgi:hypothetical protein